jgi:hypothetical protein
MYRHESTWQEQGRQDSNNFHVETISARVFEDFKLDVPVSFRNQVTCLRRRKY